MTLVVLGKQKDSCKKLSMDCSTMGKIALATWWKWGGAGVHAEIEQAFKDNKIHPFAIISESKLTKFPNADQYVARVLPDLARRLLGRQALGDSGTLRSAEQKFVKRAALAGWARMRKIYTRRLVGKDKVVNRVKEAISSEYVEDCYIYPIESPSQE